MQLRQLIHSLSITAFPLPNCDIRNIVFHSQQVQKGDLYVAIAGLNTDGHDYIHEAIAAGACAIIGEQRIENLPVPYIQVSNSRLALATLSAEYYGQPYKRHSMIGITGTNGKTTTAHMIRQILEYAKHSCSLFGTVETYMNGESFPSNMTTNDAVQLQRWLHQSHDRNVIMEVSSHGLDQHRVDGVQFDHAVFTNLSHEHLDYHKTMEHYFSSKLRLFRLLNEHGEAIINSESDWGKRLIELLRRQGVRVVSYGTGSDDSIQLLHADQSIQPKFEILENGHRHQLQIMQPGEHNIWNAMAAILTARRKDIPMPIIAEALASFPGVPGRLQTFSHPKGATIIIDYAHSPHGLLQCLKTMSVYKPKRLVHVFGFRGGRDESKWETMHALSRQFCDKTILTADDLNGVPVEDLMDKYLRLKQEGTIVIMDRTDAIAHAWNEAQHGDCILLTGKGPETYKEKFAMHSKSDAETLAILAKLTEDSHFGMERFGFRTHTK